jgi:protein-disulfide isomerase
MIRKSPITAFRALLALALVLFVAACQPPAPAEDSKKSIERPSAKNKPANTVGVGTSPSTADNKQPTPNPTAEVAPPPAKDKEPIAKDQGKPQVKPQPDAAAQAKPQPVADPAKPSAPPAKIDLARLPTKGNPTAKVTILEFSDFECPFCSRVNPTIAQVLSTYPNDVKVQFVQLPLPFHKNAHPAAQAALAAHEQGQYWQYHDLLFANQKALTRPDLERYAEQLGLDMAKFRGDLDSGKFKADVDAQLAFAGSVGVNGTPGFLVNGVVISGAVPFDNFKATIDAEILRADKVAKERGLSGQALYDELFRSAPKPAAPPAAAPAAPEDRKLIDIAGSPVFGDPNAPVTIVEFSDFECPFCSRGANTVKELVNANPGKVKVVFKHYPLDFHKNAPLASQASMAAANQGKFWEYHDLLFANQKALQRPDLERYAEQLGLNMDKFRADIDSPIALKQLEADKAAGNTAAVRGTPHFFLNGSRMAGAQPLANFQAALDKELEVAKKYLDKGTPVSDIYAVVAKAEKSASAPPPGAAPPAAAPGVPEKRMLVNNIAGAPVFGDPNAPVTIVEFSDFECPFCSRGGNTVKELVKANPGKVKVVFKHYPLDFHKNAPLASQASMAAGNQGKFWEYHDLLFANQKALQRPDLERYAEQLGLNMDKFRADLDSPAAAKQLEMDKADGNAVAVRGTPHFFLNGSRMAGAQPLANFQAALDKELEIAKKYLDKGTPAADIYTAVVKGNEPSTSAAPAAPPAAPTGPVVVDIAGAPMKGNPSAPITIVEFSDFECPFCSRVNPTIAQLLTDYPNQIKVVFKQLPLPFHKNAHLAAQASLAAHAQGKFWEFHDLLFANQKALTRPDLERYAEQLGLNMDQFRKDLDTERFKGQVDKELAESQKNGIQGTPNFAINGKRLTGAQPIDGFKAIIDAELKAAPK